MLLHDSSDYGSVSVLVFNKPLFFRSVGQNYLIKQVTKFPTITAFREPYWLGWWKKSWQITNLITYPDLPDWAHVPHFLQVRLFAILSASLQALRFEVRSFDNFKDFKSQLTHCYQFFLGRPRSFLSATSYYVHFFIYLSLRPKQSKRFLRNVISGFFKHGLFNKLSDDIPSLIFTLHIQRIIAHLFFWSLWTSAVVRAQHSLPYITLRIKLL